jgi:antitoxin MazE
MSQVLKTRVVRIGNSRGIRIPKLLMEQIGLGEEVQLEVGADHLVIRPARRQPRQGWEEQFQEMAARGEDRLLDGDDSGLSSWDHSEWEW